MRLLQRTAPARSSIVHSLVVLLCCVSLLAGCGALPRLGGEEQGAGAGEDRSRASKAAGGELIYYVAEDGLNVYSEPSAGSRLVGELPLHVRVLRSEVQSGYAHVRTEDNRVRGWVDNARLIWRLPRDAAPSQPAAAEPESPVAVPATRPDPSGEQPAPPQSEESRPEEGPVDTTAEEEPAASNSAESPPEKPEPSVFDSF